MSQSVQLYDHEWETLRCIMNATVPGLRANNLNYRRESERIIECINPESRRKLRLMIHLLSFRGSAFPFTRSPRLLTEMNVDEVADIFLGFTHSSLQSLRQLAFGLHSVGMVCRYRQDAEFRKQLGDFEPHPQLLALQQSKENLWFIPKFPIPKPLSPHEAAVVSTDVVIVGSGCSCMVAAYRLTQQGFNVIIVEKGYHMNALTSPANDFVREQEAFENRGVLASVDSSMMVLAGATVGGGGAVNWSCSLRPPEPIRREWVDKGASMYGSTEYDLAMEEVERVMQVSTTFGLEELKDTQHSFTNDLILKTSKQLNYKAKEAGQNTGKHRSNSGFIEFGSRQGSDQGGIGEWFRYALENGARLLQRSEVVKIRHRNGHASGVEVLVEGSKPLLINAKRVVCAAGSLHTPVLLQRSNFKNRHIGRGLKLHPVTVAYGEYPEIEVNKRLDPIMTAVCTETDNVDGEGHGPKIEAIHHRPILTFTFLPYRNRADWEAKVNSYHHLSALLIITRDKGDGRVSYDPRNPSRPYIQYTPAKYDINALHKGSLAGANMHYLGGAKRIYLSSNLIPDFVSDKPKEERSIWDKDYHDWYELAKRTEFRLFDSKFGSAHQMASCRMSERGPKFGAVDGKGHLYECRNVHVIDTSVFPSASGVNPMITCMASAYVLTQKLIDDLSKLQTKL